MQRAKQLAALWRKIDGRMTVTTPTGTWDVHATCPLCGADDCDTHTEARVNNGEPMRQDITYFL